MNSQTQSLVQAPIKASTPPSPYLRAVSASKRARWDIDTDVLRGRALDTEHAYLPDGLSMASSLELLSDAERRFMSQVQGRTYANIFGLSERFINAKVLELGHAHALGDQVEVEALVRFSDEELKHQELFRRVEALAAIGMPPGYRFLPDANEVADVVLGRSTWGVLAFTCHIELFTLAHYKRSIEGDAALSPLFKDVLLFHWKEESQHAVIDELEWRREDAKLDAAKRTAGVDDLLALVSAIDGILQSQSVADADYFMDHVARSFTEAERARVRQTFLRAYRYQYIGSGIEQTRFPEILFELVSEADANRIKAALQPLL